MRAVGVLPLRSAIALPLVTPLGLAGQGRGAIGSGKAQAATAAALRFRRLDLPPANAYRTANGAPGPA